MKKRVAIPAFGTILLVAVGAAAALYFGNRREVTTSSDAAYHAYRDALDSERKFYFREAREGYAKALEGDPQFVEAMLGLARLSEREQGLSLTRRAAKHAGRLTDRERFHVDMQLAGMENRQEDWLRIARAAHEKYPDDFRAAMALCEHETEAGHPERALEIFSEVLAHEPNNAQAYNNMGYFYGYRGEYDKAIESFRKYQFMAPDQANPFDSLGEIQAYSGHYDEAIENLNHALKLKPDFFESYGHLGVAYEGKGDYEKAIGYYEKAAEEALTTSRTRDFLIQALRASVTAHDLPNGRRLAAKVEALPKDPKDPYAAIRERFLRAVFAYEEGRCAEAREILLELRPKMEAAFQASVKGAPVKYYEPGWNYLMVRSLIALGDRDAAIPYLEEMASPPRPFAKFEERRWVYEGRALLAEQLARKGDLDRAEKLLAENRKWNPSWAPTRGSEQVVAQLRREKVLAASK
jgi:tetratricopeptide (TPR) repeat protein